MNNSLETFNLFPFQWTYEDEEMENGTQQCVIRIYGWNRNNESVCVNIFDYDIPIWIELPEESSWTEKVVIDGVVVEEPHSKPIIWTEQKISTLIQNFRELNGNKPGVAPVYVKAVQKHKLYFANIEKVKGKYINRKFPFIEVGFRSMASLRSFVYKLKDKKYFSNINSSKLMYKCHTAEASITPVLKFLAMYNLPSSNWIECIGRKLNEDSKESTKDHEYIVKCREIKPVDEAKANTFDMVYPRILSYDLEAYSSKPGSMPTASSYKDVVYMIGATLVEQKGTEKKYTKYVLVINKTMDPDYLTLDKKDIVLKYYKTESDLYKGFKVLINELNPDIIMGYNIFGWDIQYMDERQNLHCNISGFYRFSCNALKPATLKTISWESSAYGKQDLHYYDCEGRIFLDLLPYIKRNYKLSNYRLETVCSELLKDSNKDPIKAKDIFKAWREDDRPLLSKVAEYCAQDTWVVVQLYEKMLTWFDLTESASVNGVPLFYLYTKGQQIKLYAQLLKYCYHHDIIVQSKGIEVKEDEKYEGAYVTEPIPGLYKNILPFDFASLYPSIIQAYNLDFSKLVMDETITDECCHVFEWERHQNCCHDEEYVKRHRIFMDKERQRLSNAKTKYDKKKETIKKKSVKLGKETEIPEDLLKEEEEKLKEKDFKLRKDEEVICAKYKYRFLKADVVGKGVLPILLDNLLGARKKTRKVIEANEDRIYELKKTKGNEAEIKRLYELNMVLDKRQLAFKVSANSAYGAMGVKKGYLPLLPAAMCTTYIGRTSIKKATAFIKDKYGGVPIYGDTDSTYVNFPCLEGKTASEIWDFAEVIVEDVKQLFPSPMKLEYEGKLYTKFLILTKKRYCAEVCDKDGKIKKGLFKRGIVLVRRDNCKFLRDLYEKCVYTIMRHSNLIHSIPKDIDREAMIKDYPEISEFMYDIICNINDLFQQKYTARDFVITKGYTKEKYEGKSVPAHVLLAKKMQERGQIVQVGSRLEYVFLDNGNGYDKHEKQSEQIEDIQYFLENRELLRIHYIEYLKRQAVLPIDELLGVSLKYTGFVEEQLRLRIHKSEYIQDIKRLGKPKLVFIE